MSTDRAQKPILHGRDHCPGGADPIPCMISGPSGDFEGVLLGDRPLRLLATGRDGRAVGGHIGRRARLRPDGAGERHRAHPGRDRGALDRQDDGALEFNYDGSTVTGGRYPRSFSGDKDFDFTGSDEFTVAVWAKVKASATTRRGLIIGTSTFSVGGTPDRQIGWGLQVMYPARTIRFTYGEPTAGAEAYATTPAGVVAGDWNFVVGTYDGTTMRLYMNGELVDSTAPGAHDASANQYIAIGLGFDGGSSSTNAICFYGTVDEAAVWDRTLSQAEINALYAAGGSGA